MRRSYAGICPVNSQSVKRCVWILMTGRATVLLAVGVLLVI